MARTVSDRTPAARRIGALVAALVLVVSACAPAVPPSGTAPRTGQPTAPSGSPIAVATPTLAPTTSPAPGTAVPATPGQSATPDPTAAPPTIGPTQPLVTSPPTTPRPTAKPTPQATATPTPSPTPSLGPSLLVRHGSRTSDDVALTFDMGGRVGDALAIVDWLVGHQVHASIFMTGEMADSENTDAGRRVLATVQAHPELFTLGNHSYTHRDFRDLTRAQILDELDRTEEALGAYCSQALPPFFRPPDGGYNTSVLAAVGAGGYRYTVTWDVDTIDWRPIVNDPPGPTADQIVTKVLANAQSGSIVLMHLGGWETLDALPRIVAGLRAAGYDLVTLDELF